MPRLHNNQTKSKSSEESALLLTTEQLSAYSNLQASLKCQSCCCHTNHVYYFDYYDTASANSSCDHLLCQSCFSRLNKKKCWNHNNSCPVCQIIELTASSSSMKKAESLIFGIPMLVNMKSQNYCKNNENDTANTSFALSRDSFDFVSSQRSSLLDISQQQHHQHQDQHQDVNKHITGNAYDTHVNMNVNVNGTKKKRRDVCSLSNESEKRRSTALKKFDDSERNLHICDVIEDTCVEDLSMTVGLRSDETINTINIGTIDDNAVVMNDNVISNINISMQNIGRAEEVEGTYNNEYRANEVDDIIEGTYDVLNAANDCVVRSEDNNDVHQDKLQDDVLNANNSMHTMDEDDIEGTYNDQNFQRSAKEVNANYAGAGDLIGPILSKSQEDSAEDRYTLYDNEVIKGKHNEQRYIEKINDSNDELSLHLANNQKILIPKSQDVIVLQHQESVSLRDSCAEYDEVECTYNDKEFERSAKDVNSNCVGDLTGSISKSQDSVNDRYTLDDNEIEGTYHERTHHVTVRESSANKVKSDLTDDLGVSVSKSQDTNVLQHQDSLQDRSAEYDEVEGTMCLNADADTNQVHDLEGSVPKSQDANVLHHQDSLHDSSAEYDEVEGTMCLNADADTNQVRDLEDSVPKLQGANILQHQDSLHDSSAEYDEVEGTMCLNADADSNQVHLELSGSSNLTKSDSSGDEVGDQVKISFNKRQIPGSNEEESLIANNSLQSKHILCTSPPKFSLEVSQYNISCSDIHNHCSTDKLKAHHMTFPTLSLEQSEEESNSAIEMHANMKQLSQKSEIIKKNIVNEDQQNKLSEIQQQQGEDISEIKDDKEISASSGSSVGSNIISDVLPLSTNRPIIAFQNLSRKLVTKLKELHDEGACLVTQEIGTLPNLVNTTHFITSCKIVPHPTDHRMIMVCMRSYNYLLALVLGLHIVSPDWVKQSISDNEWAETEPFEVYSDEYAYHKMISLRQSSSSLGICRRSRILYKSNIVLLPLFGFNFYIPRAHSFHASKKLQLSYSEIQVLINIWGGEILSRFDTFMRYSSSHREKCVIIVSSSAIWIEMLLRESHDGKQNHVFVQYKSRTSEQQGFGIDVADFSWIADSIASCSLLPIDNYCHGRVEEESKITK